MDKTLHVNNLICKIAVQIILILFVLNPLKTIAQATVVKPFTQRAAAATPTQLNYRIKGDFTMIGNTNLTLAAYGDAVNNNTENMIFVDVEIEIVFNFR